MRPVALLQENAFCLAQFNLQRVKRLLQVVRLACADDRGGYAGLAEQPGQSNLSRGKPTPPGQFDDALYNVEI
jgi:hypothetical protein